MHAETRVSGVFLVGPMSDGSYVLSAPALDGAVQSFQDRQPTKAEIERFADRAWREKYTRVTR